MRVDHQPRDLLAHATTLQAGLLFVDKEALAMDDTTQLGEERAIVVIDMVHGAEGDIVGIAGVGQPKALREARELTVHRIADSIGEHDTEDYQSYYHDGFYTVRSSQ